MKKKLFKLFISFLSVVICLGIVSCSKIFDIKPKSAVAAEQMYRNVYDADAAVIGVYGKFMGLAKQYTVLNELRADLTDVTANSDAYLKQLSTHSVKATDNNPYADPRPFYAVIINCNDVLKNFNIMLSQHKMSVDQYNDRYSDVGALRSWLYLQLGIHFGIIPYVTNPIANLDDLQNQALFPRIGFDQLLDNLIQFTEALPSKMPYPTGSSLLSTYDTYYTQKFFINKNTIIGDLNLWKGNFTKAAAAYREVVRIGGIPYETNPASEQTYYYFRLGYEGNNYGVNWKTIFSTAFGERYSNYEIMWNLPFDKNFSPNNPFIDLFSVNGQYLLKPSNLVINNWNIQNDLTPGRPTDLRGLNASYRMTNGQPEVIKYTSNYTTTLPFETNTKWILYRSGVLYMRFSEAANRDGRNKLAMAFVNDGIPNAYDNTANADKTNLMQSTSPTDPTKLDVPPYDFDGRNGAIPYFRNTWYRNVGLRNRAVDRYVTIDSTKYYSGSTPRLLIDPNKLKTDIEDIIINEEGLETAFEGNRWGDLLRIALRRQSTDPNYLANKIGAKFDAALSADGAAVRARLADPANWYLPFKWK